MPLVLGTLQEPMGKKWMEVGEAMIPYPPPKKRRGISGWNVIVFGVLKWGTVDLWGDRSVLLVCGLCYFFLYIS